MPRLFFPDWMLLPGILAAASVLPDAKKLVLATALVTGLYFWWGGRFLAAEGMGSKGGEWLVDLCIAGLLLTLILTAGGDERVWLGIYTLLFTVTNVKYWFLLRRKEARAFARWKLRTDSLALGVVVALFLLSLTKATLAITGVLLMELLHIAYVSVTKPYAQYRRQDR